MRKRCIIHDVESDSARECQKLKNEFYSTVATILILHIFKRRFITVELWARGTKPIDSFRQNERARTDPSQGGFSRIGKLGASFKRCALQTCFASAESAGHRADCRCGENCAQMTHAETISRGVVAGYNRTAE
ncbi:hypothetical protein AVEN_259314-1 [Araneus ventricosus]|uniref:Uncharacterized protein n=1 Tax=Araneus ventricosus TaxID=182803 RepID=A0A4Y2GI88_ARAVE|nr:hypothetical protein AVEN_259314-1 [Araneus ventricosus]